MTFENLFLRYYAKVKRFALSVLKSEEEAEDIAQDVFLTLWKMPEFWKNDDQSIDAYLFTMTKNKIFNLIKHKKVEKNYSDELTKISRVAAISDMENLGDTIYTKELALIIKLSMDRMPKKRREIFKMSRFDNLTNAEIAKRLNLSVRTVEHHIYLALAELKEALKF